MQRNKKIILMVCGLLVFLAPFVTYLNSVHNGFLAGDDEEIILRNAYLRDAGDFYKFFTQNFKAGSGVTSNYYRPFQLLTYGIIAKTIGIKPAPFHLASILFHSLCGLLIYLVFLRLLYPAVSLPIIVLTALLWASLPIHNEEIVGATGLGSPAYLFWMLAGILAFLNFAGGNKIRWYIVCLMSFILSLFSKESAVVFPGLVLGMHIACMHAGSLKKLRLKRLLLLHAPFWLLAFIYIALRLTLLNFENTLNFYNSANIFTQNFSFRLYTFFSVVGRGLTIIFLPIGLHPEKSWPIFTSFFAPQVFWSFSVLTLLIALAVVLRKKNPIFSFGIFWFFFSYLPMSNLAVMINALAWDHWFYVPAAGILLSLASLLRKKSVQKIAYLLLAAGVTIFSIISIARNNYWKDTETLSRFILRYESGSAKTWNNLAIALAEKGRYQEAIEGYSRAIALEDSYPQSHHNLANAYASLGKYDLAEEEYLKAIAMDNRFYYSYLALGKLYLVMGEKGKAADYLQKALEIYPGLAEAKKLLKKLRLNNLP
ncbi:MAG: tetratricopeptide repeat protein [Candidatus Omnitrophica bacterium]|nr:tetratricopeptide repeat protein [Candidatus Omnitrophota bacterium]